MNNIFTISDSVRHVNEIQADIGEQEKEIEKILMSDTVKNENIVLSFNGKYDDSEKCYTHYIEESEFKKDIILLTTQMATKAFYLDPEAYASKFLGPVTKSLGPKDFTLGLLYIHRTSYNRLKDGDSDYIKFIAKDIISAVTDDVSGIIDNMKFIKHSSSNDNIIGSKDLIKVTIIRRLLQYVIYSIKAVDDYMLSFVKENKPVNINIIIRESAPYSYDNNIVDQYFTPSTHVINRAVRGKFKFSFKMFKLFSEMKKHVSGFNSKHEDFGVWKYLEELIELDRDDYMWNSEEIVDVAIQSTMLHLLYKSDIKVLSELNRISKCTGNIFDNNTYERLTDNFYNTKCVKYIHKKMYKKVDSMYVMCKHLYS